ncbi:uncharacterized protein LAESUDRAFT_644190 [Laetiporus sulphureus 93-53]|uniref:Protein kinase domain-containing protein n=1 Tax=Laetiporus sulphureus 93-53 TaxID=1314785 RepID=A0A165GWK7_9APHY|nr:uncharacterized protein LAESUDRAFT_644190 [Laetiporus sulphureus 93-53]KZT10924.1 hypothetical protein LAESUDRAFT_644190 [Laetiporus sulphureus 93-53]
MSSETPIVDVADEASDAQFPGKLRKGELYWRDRQPWLQEHGYMLRPRYRPDWKPSWIGTKRSWIISEDGVSPSHHAILDATRIADGRIVTLKRISRSIHPHEAEIGQLFSSPPLASDTRNHCVPLFEVLQDPIKEDMSILVMPLLRKYNDPRFGTIGEAVEFFRQLFEGLQFMHKQHVAHRDIMRLNVMLDPQAMYLQLYHPNFCDKKLDMSGNAKHYTRTERPTRYYLTDFGLSRKYDPSAGPPNEYPIIGGDRTVPEFQRERMNEACNPFPTDIYCTGNLIREDFLRKYYGLEFMEKLIEDMVQDDPAKRPTIDDVVSRFDEIRNSLKRSTLRSRLVAKNEDVIIRVLMGLQHAFRTTSFVVRRLPAIPTPSESTSIHATSAKSVIFNESTPSEARASDLAAAASVAPNPPLFTAPTAPERPPYDVTLDAKVPVTEAKHTLSDFSASSLAEHTVSGCQRSPYDITLVDAKLEAKSERVIPDTRVLASAGPVTTESDHEPIPLDLTAAEKSSPHFVPSDAPPPQPVIADLVTSA